MNTDMPIFFAATVNLVFGWTIIGWIGALLWAVHVEKEAK